MSTHQRQAIQDKECDYEHEASQYYIFVDRCYNQSHKNGHNKDEASRHQSPESLWQKQGVNPECHTHNKCLERQYTKQLRERVPKANILGSNLGLNCGYAQSSCVIVASHLPIPTIIWG